MPHLRFSLRAFFLLLFIASLVASNFFTAWQLGRSREEVIQLQKELGRLVVTDRDKVNVVAVPTYEDMLWRWRLYVPKGMSLNVHIAAGKIPPRGIPDIGSCSSGPIEEGEYVMTAAVRRDRNNKWQFTVERKSDIQGGTARRSSGINIADEDAGWLTGNIGWGASIAGAAGSTETHDLNGPFELLRARSFKRTSPSSSSSTSAPTDGVVLWLTKRKLDEQ